MNLIHDIAGVGPEYAKVLFILDHPLNIDVVNQKPLQDFAGKNFIHILKREGINPNECRFEYLIGKVPRQEKYWTLTREEIAGYQIELIERLKKFNPNVLVPVGELPLKAICGKTSILKWHLSILESIEALGKIKTIPLLSPTHCLRKHEDHAFQIIGAQKIKRHMEHPEMPNNAGNHIIRPDLNLVLKWLQGAKNCSPLSCDIETMKGQISCVGLAIDGLNAISIPTKTNDWSQEEFYAIWAEIARLLEAPTKKIFQNLTSEIQSRFT